MFLKPEARAGQSDSTSIMACLGTLALALTAAAGIGQCASPARKSCRETVKDEDRHDRQPCLVFRRRRNLAHSYLCLWIVKFNCCR